MGQVVVKINGRDFPLSCPDGQEPRIRRLAQYVDTKTVEFRNSLGQIGGKIASQPGQPGLDCLPPGPPDHIAEQQDVQESARLEFR